MAKGSPDYFHIPYLAEEVRGERMPKRVGMYPLFDPRLRRVPGHHGLNVPRLKGLSDKGGEHKGRGLANCLGLPLSPVAEGFQVLLRKPQDPIFPALPLYVETPSVEIHVRPAKGNRLRKPESCVQHHSEEEVVPLPGGVARVWDGKESRLLRLC
jgi:hypothetical protein